MVLQISIQMFVERAHNKTLHIIGVIKCGYNWHRKTVSSRRAVDLAGTSPKVAMKKDEKDRLWKCWRTWKMAILKKITHVFVFEKKKKSFWNKLRGIDRSQYWGVSFPFSQSAFYNGTADIFNLVVSGKVFWMGTHLYSIWLKSDLQIQPQSRNSVVVPNNQKHIKTCKFGQIIVNDHHHF